MFREEHSYYVKELRHYKDLSLDDYRQMISLRIDGLVVKNQRCINPIDEFDRDAYFCNVWNVRDDYLAATLRVRTRPGEVVGDDGYIYNYPIFDRCVVADKTISMFPGTAPIHLYCGDWTTEIYGATCGSFTLYDEPAKILERLGYARKIGMNIDENGYPGHVFVIEFGGDRDECNRLMAKYEDPIPF